METKVAYCPHCGHNSAQQMLFSTWDGPAPEDIPAEEYDPFGMEDYHLLARCLTCKGVLLYNTSWLRLISPYDLQWPQTKTISKHVPKRVRELYIEANKVKAVSPSSFSVQIGRALEALCDDRKAGNGTLEGRLDKLKTRGEIPPTLMEMTYVLRLLRNRGAHNASSDVSDEDAVAIDDFFRAIVEYVYVAPARVQEVRSQLTKIEMAD